MKRTTFIGNECISMKELKAFISVLGSELVSCRENSLGNCVEIHDVPQRGIIPRCLYLESDGRFGEKGSVVIGINPGISTESERDYYHKKGNTYEAIFDHWKDGRLNVPYYAYLRDFINCMKYKGPILWTEIVKCESIEKKKSIPLNTIRTCTFKYLNLELKKVPDDWHIIAVGREPFNLLKYILIDKPVLGIPHPNSRGNFHKMFIDNKKRNRFDVNIENQIKDFEKSKNAAMWLKTNNY